MNAQLHQPTAAKVTPDLDLLWQDVRCLTSLRVRASDDLRRYEAQELAALHRFQAACKAAQS